MKGLGEKRRHGWMFAGGVLALMAGGAFALQAATNLVGHWPLDEAAGPTAADATANANDGVWNGAPTAYTPVPAPIMSWSTNALCVARPGQNYVEIPNSALLENIQEADYTISAWFNPIDVPPSDTAQGEPNQNEGIYGIVYKTGWHEGLGYNNSSQFVFDKWVLDAGGADQWSGTGTWNSTFAPGQWYHVAGVADFAAATVSIYVDGTLEFTSGFQAGYSQPYREYNQNPWRIGIANPAGGYTNWEYQANGYIDDVRLYDRALTAGEIANIANGTDMGAVVAAGPGPGATPAAISPDREGDEGCGCGAIAAPRAPFLAGLAALAAALLLLVRRRAWMKL